MAGSPDPGNMKNLPPLLGRTHKARTVLSAAGTTHLGIGRDTLPTQNQSAAAPGFVENRPAPTATPNLPVTARRPLTPCPPVTPPVARAKGSSTPAQAQGRQGTSLKLAPAL